LMHKPLPRAGLLSIIATLNCFVIGILAGKTKQLARFVNTHLDHHKLDNYIYFQCMLILYFSISTSLPPTHKNQTERTLVIYYWFNLVYRPDLTTGSIYRVFQQQRISSFD
jgi:hypothetical protein